MELSDIIFFEFNNKVSIDSQVAYSFNKNCQYNIIFGVDFLYKFGFTINYDENIFQWMDHKISLKNPDEFFSTNMFINLNKKLCQDTYLSKRSSTTILHEY